MAKNGWQYTPTADSVPFDWAFTCPCCGSTRFQLVGDGYRCHGCGHLGGEWQPNGIAESMEIPDVDIESLL